ncbi:MAG: ribonuclease H-like YkuK family protein [Patescibacteria group bacterium]
MNQLLFNSSYGVKFSVKQIVQEIVSFMAFDMKRRYKITIGTDSERIAGNQADFVSAVVVHRVGNGGRYFWRRVELGKFHTLRDRIIKEVLLSLELAQEVLAELKKIKDISFDFEIHADIGENGETKVMIQEVVGMIRAHNFEVRTKPGSYAASNVADRHV